MQEVEAVEAESHSNDNVLLLLADQYLSDSSSELHDKVNVVRVCTYVWKFSVHLLGGQSPGGKQRSTWSAGCCCNFSEFGLPSACYYIVDCGYSL